MAFGSLLRSDNRYLVDYYLGLFNGSGINTLDVNEAKDVIGRIVIHPFPILDIGAVYYTGMADSIQWISTVKPRPLNKSNLRQRIGGELAINYKNLAVRAEYIQGQDGYQKYSFTENNVKTTEIKPLKRAGWYAQAGYFIFPKKLQVIVKYDTYDPNTLNNTTKLSSSLTDATTYYIYGLNYYFNDWVRLYVNWSQRKEQTTSKIKDANTINNDLISAQLQVNF